VRSLSDTIRDMTNAQRSRSRSQGGRALDDSALDDDSLKQAAPASVARSRVRAGADDEEEDSESELADAEPKHSTAAGVSGSVKVMFSKIKDQQRRIEQLVHREGLLQAENKRCEEALDIYRTRASEMMEEIENLRIELEGRPTVRAFSQKQREVKELESKLHDVIMMRKEAAEVASWRKHLSTSDRIKVDKRNHQLGLWIIESIPTAVVKEVLQAACRELDISDISELQPSISKLKAVVKLVPRMEAFIARLCGFVFDRQAPRHPEGDVKEEPSMEDALPIMKK
jgi:hypothetical protein